MNRIHILLALILLPASTLHAQLTAFTRDGKWGFKDAAGKEVVPARYAGVGRSGLATSGGKIVDVFSEGMAPVTIAGTPTGLLGTIEGGKWGYINAEGKEVVALRYDEAEDFKDGYAVVTLQGKKGLVGKNGKEAIPPRYDAVQPSFSDGLATVAKSDKWGYVAPGGKEVIACKYLSAKPFSEGFAAVAPGPLKSVQVGSFSTASYEFGFIDKQDRLVVPAAFQQPLDRSLAAPLQFDEGQARVSKDGKVAYIDRKGEVTKPSLKHTLYEIYADSYKGFSKTAGATLLQEDAARKIKYYNTAAPIGTGSEVVGISEAGRSVYRLQYQMSDPAQAAAAKAAVPVFKALIADAVRNGWLLAVYHQDYGADADGNEVITMLQHTQGLPDPRTARIKLTTGERKTELLILGSR